MDETDHFLLGLEKERKIKGFLGIHVLGDDEFLADKIFQGLVDLGAFDFQFFGAVLTDIFLEREDVSLLGILLHEITDKGFGSFGRCGAHPQLQSHLVGGFKPDPPDIMAGLVGIGLEDAVGIVSVLAVF